MLKAVKSFAMLGIIALSSVAQAANTLPTGVILSKGQSLMSNNGIYMLIMQPTDGNLVLYYVAPGGATTPLGWSSGTGGHYAVQQDDGNFCVYRANNTWQWTSQTGGRPISQDYKFVLGDDGGLTIYGPQNTVVRNVHAADGNCGSSGRAPRGYPACKYGGLPPSGGPNQNITVIARCGVEARNLALAQGASLGACP
jgi:hypothetical protein